MKTDDVSVESITAEATLFRGFALPREDALLEAISHVTREASLRHMKTPRGHAMSVAMSNCGEYGWVTDRQGYRYTTQDPETGRDWPSMPGIFSRLATNAAHVAGFDNFAPDVCLINRYVPGAKMGLHQDRDERDFSQPIVSVSLGMPARFLFGGFRRNDKPEKILLQHGDVLVWGGRDRMRYHGVMPVRADPHPRLGECRYNLTFRRAN